MLVKLAPTDFDALMASARAGLQAQATLLDAINKSAIEQVKAEVEGEDRPAETQESENE